MKILHLRAENFKRLRAVEITPDPNTGLIELRGRNAQGKSSVLDAIWAALGGAAHHPTKPVRNGESKATIQINLGDLQVTRRFRADGATDLRVTAADGARYPSPQTVIDKLIGQIAFDPLAFMRLKPKEQLEQLRQTIKLDIDLDALDRQNQQDYTQRTQINRDAQALRIRLDSLPRPDESTTPLPTTQIDVSLLTRRLAEVSSHNIEIASRSANRAAFAEKIKSKREEAASVEAALPALLSNLNTAAAKTAAELDERITDLRRQIIILEDRKTSLNDELVHAQEQTRLDADETAATLRAQADADEQKLNNADPLPALIDAEALAAEIEQATQQNRLIEAAARRHDVANQLQEAEVEAEHLTTQINQRAAQKRDALAAAQFPVPGLALGPEQILLNDLPLDQASSAEQLRVSVALAMAANPTLRVLCVRDGSLLDRHSLAALADMVSQHDYQCWIEVTDDDATVGIIIEDGAIVTHEANAGPDPIGFEQELPV